LLEGGICARNLLVGAYKLGAIKNDRLSRFLELIAPENEARTLDMLCERLCEGETIGAVCMSLDVPYGRVMSWLKDDAGRFERFRRSIEIASLCQAQEAVSIVDEAVPVLESGGMDSAAVSDKKLRADMRLKVAKYHAREIYGDVRKIEHGVSGDFGERLRRARERVIEGEVVRQEQQEQQGSTLAAKLLLDRVIEQKVKPRLNSADLDEVL